jgi:hypothetical protein
VGNVAITLLCLGGAAVCLGLAIWLFRREQPKRQNAASQSTFEVGNEPAIERTFVEPKPDTGSREAVFIPTALQADPKTEFIPREELLAAAERRTQALAQAPAAPPVKDETTESLLRAEVVAATQRLSQAQAVPGTEVIRRDVLLARQRALAPTFDPKHIPSPPRAASPPISASAPTGLTSDELEPQLLDAERAFARWQHARGSMTLERVAESPEPTLRQAIGVVAAASDHACVELLEPTLSRAEVSVHRRQVVALVLLLRNEAQALRLIDPCVGEAKLAPAFREVLSLWRGRETDWRLREQARHAGNTRMFWLDLLDDRRIDPGPELLDELLASNEPELTVRGLQLAKYHDDPERRMQAAQTHLTNMRQPAQRMAAVELALFDRQPAAWMFCRQMANAPEYPRATELVAALGTARELEPLVRRLERADGEGLWRLCRSGRKAAAALAARRLQDTRGDELAAVALRYVIGDPPSEARSAEALVEHWLECAPSLADDRRYLYGEQIGYTNSVRRCLTSREDRHHRAFGDELFFRSHGKIRWPGRGFAQDTLTGLTALRTHTIDFDTGLVTG